MKVLSLFDGISCGQLALQRAGANFQSYAASEVDVNAIKITNRHFPNTVQLGDVSKITTYDCDLLIGGSPCQGFSNGGLRGNFQDPRSKLFWEYVRLKNTIKPKWFLLENVKMKKEWSDIITQEIGVEPIEIDSGLVSAQTRRRLYWTNIPFSQIIDKKLTINDILTNTQHEEWDISQVHDRWLTKNYLQWDVNGTGHKSQDARAYFPTGKSGTLTCSHILKYYKDGAVYKFNLIEHERLQTLPDNYTEGISRGRRIHAIGNGWTVDIIAHIFGGLK